MSVNNSIKARVLAHLHQELGLLSAEIAAKTAAMNRKMLMNLQGMTFTEQGARDYYGSRFETTELVWVTLDEEGEVVEGKSDDCV